MSNREKFQRMFSDLLNYGELSSPRGMKIMEQMNRMIVLSPDDPFMGFKARAYNVDYFRKEMVWKLGADPYDESIKQHAKMWESVQNPDGTFNSNYGQYWFGDQQGLMTAFMELVRDRDSRRAVIPMLMPKHVSPGVKDTVCTMGVGFHIRRDRLDMTVYMRSSDQVFGLGTDVPTFSFLYRLMYAMIKEQLPDVYRGIISITAMSSHVYERHFEMIKNIVDEKKDQYIEYIMPWCRDASEARSIIASRGKLDVGVGPLSDWLIGVGGTPVATQDDDIPF